MVFTETSTIGLREHAVTKRPLVREEVRVRVAGAEVRVKLSRLGGRAVTAQPEWEDVAAAARAAGRPARLVLAEAQALALALLGRTEDDDEETTTWS